MSSVYCKVRACRWSHTHTTSGHFCGRCSSFGHGQMECDSALRRRALQANYGMDKLPVGIQCSVVTCETRDNHTTEAHVCPTCGVRGGTCPCSAHVLTRKCPICRVVSEVDLHTELFTGTDCTVCMEQKPMIVFSACKHAQVCRGCVHLLGDM